MTHLLWSQCTLPKWYCGEEDLQPSGADNDDDVTRPRQVELDALGPPLAIWILDGQRLMQFHSAQAFQHLSHQIVLGGDRLPQTEALPLFWLPSAPN